MPKTAYNSIDHTRCVLMVLVIMVHTVKFGELYPAVKDFINFFFMPAFLLLTGYLVNVEKSPRDFGRYLWKIILPYTVMVTGFACLSTLLPVRDGIGSLTPAALARALLVTGIGPYWFLHTMVVCGTLYWLAFRLPVRRWAAAVRLGAFGLLLLATVKLTPLLGGTYALFSDDVDVILTATRAGLSNDSEDPKTWNGDANKTLKNGPQVTFYRSLIYATPSAYGKELAAKVNAGEELTWEDLNSANWSVMGTSSPAGYIYPALWLQDHYGKGISDLKSAVQSDSYASAFARLASGQVDVLVTYADARRDYAERWNTEFSREGSIWEETGVIGVTAPIYNDTISVSKNSEIMDADLIAALQQAFINIGNTEEGKQVIAIYSHNGYQKAQSSDYDNERAAQKLIQELSAAN